MTHALTQLPFDQYASSSHIMEAYSLLHARFGAPRDRRRRDPVSQLIDAIISSQTYDAVSESAYLRLRRRYPRWEALLEASEADVFETIADVTHAERKAPCLLAALQAIQIQRGSLSLDFLAELSSDAAMSWLERLHGVGRKIAAEVVNFSTLRGYAFVIDTHVLRVAQRLGWIASRAKTAEKAYPPLMMLMPREWEADDLCTMQRLLKGLGQSFCTYGEPHCRECPLRQLCASYLAKPSEAEQEKTAPLSNDQVCSSDPVIALRQEITRLERSAQRADWGVVPFGEPSIDSCMPHGGLQLGHWHEIGGLGMERERPAAVTGFVAALASATQRGGAIIWTLRRDDLYAPGLQAFGVAPDRLILVRVDKDEDVLSVQEDALRTRGVTAAIGEVDKIDLTAGRRLQLVCEKSGATGFVLRRKLFGTPLQQPPLQAPAAATRWRIAAASSQTQTPGLGSPRWTARLDRCRGGRTGAWIMEMQNASEAAPSTIRVVAELADHTSATEHAHAVRTRARHHDFGGQRTASGRN